LAEKKFSGVFANLANISNFVVENAEAAGLNEKAVYAVQLAVDEACTNIIEHAYGGEGKGDIWIKCEVRTGGLEVEIRDKGKPFNPEKVPKPKVGIPLEEFGPRGAGVFLMRKLMDDVQFEFFEKETVLRMMKRKSG
jgi:anti-sigma regulatory factor (Ser/Thr protein kinase)